MSEAADPRCRCSPARMPGLCTPRGLTARSSAAADRGVDELLGLAHERIEVRRAFKTLRVDLVDVLRAGRPSREPPARGHDLQTVYRRVVARGPGQLGGDPLAGERLVLDRIG